MKSKLKNALSIILRVGIAVAGLAYVATALTWTDQVQVPEQFALSIDGKSVAIAAGAYPVQSESPTHVTIAAEGGQTHAIPRDRITQDKDGAVFRPGIASTLAEANVLWLVVALLMFGPMLMLQNLRWVTLMRCRGLPSPVWGSFRIYMVGVFFNSFMPGTTGGDLMKAYYVARRASQREAAVVSVIADRMVGMVALVMLASVAALIGLGGDLGGDELRAIAIIGCGILIAGAVYFTPFLRKVTGLSFLASKLPRGGMIHRVTDAVGAYRHHKGHLATSLAFGLAVHAIIVGATILSGWAMGMTTPTLRLAAVLPLIMMAGALPLSFMGLGVMEPMGIALIADGGVTATANQVVTMLVLARLYQVVYSLLGAVFLMRGNLDLSERVDPGAAGDGEQPPESEAADEPEATCAA